MFSFLFKSGKALPDLSFIEVDMHSHLLPGLDDGLQTIEQTIAFVQELEKLGYKKLICTPHILSDLHPNSKDTILPKLDLVRTALADAGVKMEIDAAAEYMIDHEFEQKIAAAKRRDDLLTIAKNYILVEMSYLAASPNYEKVIFDLRMLGLTPILAHPERYSYYHRNYGQYERFKELGCKLQINLLSLSGGYGPDVKKVAEKLIKNDMIDFLGTDMHHERHLNALKDLVQRREFHQLVANIKLKNKLLL